VTLDEEPVHRNGGNHYGTLAVRTDNNHKACRRLQSQDGVTLEGMPVYQNRESHCDIQTYHTHNMFQVHWLWLTPKSWREQKLSGRPEVSRGGVTVVHSETVEPEICQAGIGTSEVGMAVVVVDPDQRNAGSTADSEDAMAVAAAEE